MEDDINERMNKISDEYKTLEQQIVSLWKSRGMDVKTIEFEYPTWKITVEKVKYFKKEGEE